jgi:hypothetical protein
MDDIFAPFLGADSSSRRLRVHYFFQRLHASQFFSPFSYNLFQARYSQCIFSQMLHSSIVVAAKTYRNHRTELTSYSPDDDVIEVLDSQFSSENQFNGGAINILKEGSSLAVSRTTFHHCFASYRGGAISFFGRRFTLENVYFMHCETSDSAMAVESHLDPENSSIDFTQVALTQCADEETLQDFRFASLCLVLGAQHQLDAE